MLEVASRLIGGTATTARDARAPRVALHPSGLGIADAISTLARTKNARVSPTDATIKMAKPDQMKRLPTDEVLSSPERNGRVEAFVTLRLRHTIRRKTRGRKSAGNTLDHRRYVKAQVMAARSEAAWTPHTTE